ncbi:serine/threonine-protein kinase [Streptomyces sp. NPDC002402]
MREGLLLADRYRLHELIGAGGMGEVWKATDVRLGRDVAVKAIGLPPSAGAERCRFDREARAAGQLSSPHVVTVHDVGEAVVGGRQIGILVMALLSGQPLSTVLAAGLPSLENVVAWGQQVCQGLQAAHDAGVVHRDIKPSNVILSPEGQVTIVDFGIAHLATAPGDSVLTVPGVVLGTPSYMAPEQARGDRAVDGRCDLYALGCMLYELLTGAPPFGRSDGPLLEVRSAQEPLPVSRHRPGVPVALDRLILELLNRDPADRPADATDVGRRLGAAISPNAPALCAAFSELPTRTAAGRSPGATAVITRPAKQVPPLPHSTGMPRSAVARPGLRAGLAGAAGIWTQLATLSSLPAMWAGVLAVIAGVGVVLVHKEAVPTAQSSASSCSCASTADGGAVELAAMVSTLAVTVLLLFWSDLVWWGVLGLAVLLSPVLLGCSSLIRSMTAHLTRRTEASLEPAVAAGLLNGALVAVLLGAGHQLPLAGALVCGGAVWLVAAIVAAVPLRPAPATCWGHHQ